VSIEVVQAADRPDEWGIEDAGFENEHFVVATGTGGVVGQALVAPAGPVYVAELQRTIPFEGGSFGG
jgi:hypothetical protein